MIKVQTSFCGKIRFVGWKKQWKKYFTFMHLAKGKKCLFQRKQRTNQSILKVDFSNAINKINCKKKKMVFRRGG